MIFVPEKFTVWDYLEVKDVFTFGEFFDFFKENYSIGIDEMIINNRKFLSFLEGGR